MSNDWKLEKSKLDKSSPFQQGERWKRLQMIDQSRKKVQQHSSPMRAAILFCIYLDHVTQVICAVNQFTVEPITFSQMAPERYGSTYPGHKFPMRD